MGFQAGFDTSHYPGDSQMAWLKANTNLAWCGFYLAPAPSHSDTGWMNTRATLVAQGWGLAPVYLGQQTAGPGSHIITAAQGSLDGANAAQLAGQAGFAKGSYVYLDVEDGSAPTAASQAYIKAWAQALAQQGYSVGIYCSHVIAANLFSLLQALELNATPRIWAYKVSTTATHAYTGSTATFPTPDPAGSGYASASIWQREQNCTLSLPGAPVTAMTVDLNTAGVDLLSN